MNKREQLKQFVQAHRRAIYINGLIVVWVLLLSVLVTAKLIQWYGVGALSMPANVALFYPTAAGLVFSSWAVVWLGSLLGKVLTGQAVWIAKA